MDELTPPADPADVEAWLTKQEDAVAARFAAEVGSALVPAVEAYAATLTAAGDPGALDAVTSAYARAALAAAEDMASLYAAGGLHVWMGFPNPTDQIGIRFAGIVNEAAVAYQSAAWNRIVVASAGSWTDIRDAIVNGLTSGASNDDIAALLADVTGRSEAAARVIARTETTMAYNGGSIGAARALGEDGPDRKEWLSASDARTRESHAEANGMVVPIGESFVVGGVPMDHPGDPAGPPDETANCRCTMLLHYPGDGPDAMTAAGAPSGIIVAALVEGDEVVTYGDGDESPLHQTLAYLGDTSAVSRDELAGVVAVVERLAADMPPFVARVCGVAELGPEADRVLLTEAVELQGLHDAVLAEPDAARLDGEYNLHPSWISHVSVGSARADASFGDEVRFDRLAVMAGAEVVTFPLSGEISL